MLKKILMALFSCLLLSPAFAAETLTFTLSETGGNVVLTADGKANTGGLVNAGNQSCGPDGKVMASFGVLCVGAGNPYPTPPTLDRTLWTGLSGPSSFGTGGISTADTNTGDAITLDARASVLGLQLPNGYAGTTLTATATFNSKTLATMGVTPGTYTWTYGTGDTVVLTASGGAPIPTLSEWGMIFLSSLLAMVGIATVRRRNGGSM